MSITLGFFEGFICRSYSSLFARFSNSDFKFMIDPTSHIFYKTWKDRGGNIGVQCVDCDQTFWTGKERAGGMPSDLKRALYNHIIRS